MSSLYFISSGLSCVFLAVGGDNGAVVALPAHKNLLSHPQTLNCLFCWQVLPGKMPTRRLAFPFWLISKLHMYRVVRWNQDKSNFLDKTNIKHSFFNRFISNKKQKVGLGIVFIFYSKKSHSASMTASTWPQKAMQSLATMALSTEAKFSLKVLSSHLNWGARLDSFDPLLNSRWPASLKFFF